MTKVFIEREITREEKVMLRKLQGSDLIELYISAGLSNPFDDLKAGIFEPSPEEKREINYQVLDRVLSMGEKEIDGIKIIDWLRIEVSSIWHYHKFRAYFSLVNLAYKVHVIKKETFGEEHTLIFTDDRSLAGYDFGNAVVKIHYHKSAVSKKLNIVSLFKYLIFISIRLFKSATCFREQPKSRHLVVDRAKRQSVLDRQTLENRLDNNILAYLFDELDREFTVIQEAVPPKIRSKEKFSIRDNLFSGRAKTGNLFAETVLIKSLFYPGIWIKYYRKTRQLSHAYIKVSAYLSDPYDKILWQIIRNLHSASRFYIYRYYAFCNYFNGHSYKTVTATDENSPYSRSILDAGKKAGIRTIGIQHGNINELHSAYAYSKQDRMRKAVPDVTLVWGPFWSELLENSCNYPPNSTVVTGQIRADIIPVLRKARNLKAKLGISENCPLILFASQPQRDPFLREMTASVIYQAVQSLEGIYFLQKLHPGEKDDVNYYQSIAAKSGLKNLKTVYDADLYLLLACSDMVITSFSTVGTEAIYFDKPLIIYDPLKQDIQNYHKEGVAFQATNAEEMEAFIKGILNHSLNPMAEAYDRFRSRYAYMIDGKAVERCLSEITKSDR